MSHSHSTGQPNKKRNDRCAKDFRAVFRGKPAPDSKYEILSCIWVCYSFEKYVILAGELTIFPIYSAFHMSGLWIVMASVKTPALCDLHMLSRFLSKIIH